MLRLVSSVFTAEKVQGPYTSPGDFRPVYPFSHLAKHTPGLAALLLFSFLLFSFLFFSALVLSFSFSCLLLSILCLFRQEMRTVKRAAGAMADLLSPATYFGHGQWQSQSRLTKVHL